MNTTKKRRPAAAKAPVEQTPVEKMTPTELALAFGNECLGWKSAKIVGEPPTTKKLFYFDKLEGWQIFDFMSLESVMQAVREWFSSMDGYEVEAKYYDTILTFYFGDFLIGTQDQAEVCRDFMAACVEARRREK